jgi:hypothetical protein
VNPPLYLVGSWGIGKSTVANQLGIPHLDLSKDLNLPDTIDQPRLVWENMIKPALAYSELRGGMVISVGSRCMVGDDEREWALRDWLADLSPRVVRLTGEPRRPLTRCEEAILPVAGKSVPARPRSEAVARIKEWFSL